MRMIARRATKVPSRSLSTRHATTQAPHCAETRMGRLPRHGQRSLGCGSGSMSAPFYDVSCGSLRPFPHHAARDRVRGAFPAICFVARLAKGVNHSLRFASRISSRKASVAPSWDLIRGSCTSGWTSGVEIPQTRAKHSSRVMRINLRSGRWLLQYQHQTEHTLHHVERAVNAVPGGKTVLQYAFHDRPWQRQIFNGFQYRLRSEMAQQR